MKKLLLTIASLSALAIGAQSVKAQGSTYANGIGLRLGYNAALSYKHFISNAGALEGIVGLNLGDNYLNIAAMYEHHLPIKEVSGLQWYFGAGMGAVFYDGGPGFSVNGILGLDYKFNNAPFNISLDWMPGYYLNDDLGFTGKYGGLSVRYTF